MTSGIDLFESANITLKITTAYPDSQEKWIAKSREESGSEVAIYQAKGGVIELSVDVGSEAI